MKFILFALRAPLLAVTLAAQTPNPVQPQVQPPAQAPRIAPATIQAAPGQTNLDALSNLMLQQPPTDVDSPISVEAQFDPPMLSVGAYATYRLMLTAMNDAIKLPNRLPAPPGLELVAGGRGQIYLPIGTKLLPRTTLNFRATSKVPGTFVMPAFNVTVYGKPVAIPPARVVFVDSSGVTVAGSPKAVIEVPEGDFYLGQSILVRVLLLDPGNNSVQGLTQLQITGEAFMTDMNAMRQRREIAQRDGRSVLAIVSDAVVVPIRPGKHKIMAQLHAVVTPPTLGGTANPALFMPFIDSEPVEVTIQSLPKAGELAGFTGAIGQFQVDPPKLSSREVKVGDPVTLAITVKGEGNFSRLVPPRVMSPPNWQIFPATSDPIPGFQTPMQGSRLFTYTLIPTSARVQATPAIPFAYFDPQKKVYVDLTIPPVEIKVAPGPAGTSALAANVQLPYSDAEDLTTRKEDRPLALTGLAETPGWRAWSLVPLSQRPWFLFIQLLPGGMLAGLWLWDRRRQYLERHPEVMRRRRALRALKRQMRNMRKAAASQNAPEYVAAAVAALRQACAPQVAANPEALVCEDVLSAMDPAARHGDGGKVIRQLFTAADTRHFIQREPAAQQVFAMKPALEQILSQLKTQLNTGIVIFRLVMLLMFAASLQCMAAPETRASGFNQGTQAYFAGNFQQAASHFRQAAQLAPAAGALHNLGNAEWKSGHQGPAILAWERAYWLDPFDANTRANLKFARKTAQIENPNYAWHEICSTWLPSHVWAGLAMASFWSGLALVMLPGILRWRKTDWHQGLAAGAFAVFFLTIPALAGIHARSRSGIILPDQVALRLTPTREAQILGKLSAGEMARLEKQRGDYVYVRAGNDIAGWVERKEFGLICARQEEESPASPDSSAPAESAPK